MTKEFQKELKEKIKEGIKPSTLKKLKRSKSADDIPASSTSNIPLKKSQSHLEIPLQPQPKEQIAQLQEQVQFQAQTAANYLKSLQTTQAKVQELEEKLKSNPPQALLTDQLKVKQKEVEELRKTLELTHQELNSLKSQHSTLLDDNLSLKHQSLKDWWQQYEKTKDLETELKEQVDYASEELLNQDKVISSLRTENHQLKLTNQSLTKDLNLATKLAELRRNPLPNPENTTFWQAFFYGLTLVLFINLLNSSWNHNFKDNE